MAVPPQKLALTSVIYCCVFLVIAANMTLASDVSTCSNRSGHKLLKDVSIPPAISVPSGHKLHSVYYASGLQHYSFNGSDWVNFNATANLYCGKPHGLKTRRGAGHIGYYSSSARVLGQHFFLAHPDALGGQPSWDTWFPAFSLVTAKSIEAVTVDPKSISWNLLQATSTSGNKDLLGAVTYLQRLASKGGLPPTSTQGVQTGDVHDTPYSIIYTFYVKAS